MKRRRAIKEISPATENEPAKYEELLTFRKLLCKLEVIENPNEED